MNMKISLFTSQNLTYLILSICFIPIAYIVKKIDFGFYINIVIIMALCMTLYAGVLLLRKDESIYVIVNKVTNKLKLKKE